MSSRLTKKQRLIRQVRGQEIDRVPSLAGWIGGVRVLAELAGIGADTYLADPMAGVVKAAVALDATRPVTFVGVMGGPQEWLELPDIVCINRYWGWYTQGGQLEAGLALLEQELDGLHAAPGKPIIITEFGADTVAGMHSHPAKMFSEEYQVEFLRGYLDVAGRKPFVIGLHVWNFADFQAVQSVSRVGGMNLKGVFTRQREPKMAAHLLRERWAQPG